MTIPSGVQKSVIIGKESTWNSAAATNVGKQMRRVTATVDLAKDTMQSAEIRTDYQLVDFRHGTRRTEGALNGEISCGTYEDLIAAALRASAWTAGSTTGAVIVIAADNAGTYTRSTGSFVSDGFKVGDLVTVSGFTDAGNNGTRRITALTATVMTVAIGDTPMTDEAEGDSVTILVAGKKCMVPSTGHADTSFTIESYYEMGSTDIYELATGNKVSSVNITIQPNQMSQITFNFMGGDMSSDSSAHFVSPTAQTTTGVMSGAQAVLLVNGVENTTVTGLTVNLEGGMENMPVIGSDKNAGIAVGRVIVTGTLSAYLTDATLWNAFSDESELGLLISMTDTDGDSFSLHVPRIKLSTGGKDDKEVGGIIGTYDFQALKYRASGNYDASTIVFQDTSL